MQVQNQEKRAKILSTAARMFATQPFHKVILSDVAEAAGVGKGTLYVYFKSKEDLYLAVLYDGFTQLVDRLRARIDHKNSGPIANLLHTIDEIVGFAYASPHLFEVMRTARFRGAVSRAEWDGKRRELKELIETIIREGIRNGEFKDPHPELTARFIPGLARSVFIEGTENVDRRVLSDHIGRFVLAGLGARPQATEK